MAHGKPPQLVPTTLYVPPDVAAFLSAAANKMRLQGNAAMTRDRLASISILIGLSGISRREGSIELSDELVAMADALASGCPLPGA